MAKAKVKLPTMITPVVTAGYAWVNKPDSRFAKEGDEGSYKITGIFEDDEDARNFMSKIEELAREVGPQMDPAIKLKKNLTHVPWDFPEDDDIEDEKLSDNFKGNIRLIAKSNYKPAQIDSLRQELPPNVFVMSGDKVRFKYAIKPFDGLGGGISLKLKTVQLIEKVHNFSGVDTSGFDDVDGYVAPTKSDKDDF